jgi:SAM-dependent methyltransferase
VSKDDGVDWAAYLEQFHAERAGAAEAVLSRAVGGDHSPYRWLARAVSVSATVVLDLACGSGPMSRELAQPGRTVIGLDLSAGELALAAQRSSGPWVRADALRLPVRDASVEVVTSSLGLVVAQPLGEVLAEVARVLRPGGVLAAIAPALRPLWPRDVELLTQVNARLRTRPQFPGPVELAGFTKTLQHHGLKRVEDARELYHFRIEGRVDAETMLRSLYLPTTRWSRVEAAIEYLEARVQRHGPVEIAIPMRRLVAIK